MASLTSYGVLGYVSFCLQKSFLRALVVSNGQFGANRMLTVLGTISAHVPMLIYINKHYYFMHEVILLELFSFLWT